MGKILAKSTAQSSDTSDKYSMFIGRWQPWHQGHRWLIDQRLKEDKKVLLCIRDVKPDKNNPWSASDIYCNLTEQLYDLIAEKKVMVMIIPDIESINIGRGVGYDVIEHIPPQSIHDISATKIRATMKKEGKL